MSPLSATSMMWSKRSISAVPLRRLGDSLRLVTHPRSSPTRMMGCLGLKLILVSLALRTIFCSHMGSCLFSNRSYTCTLPSLVTAANVVTDDGDHATSPTALLRSNDITALAMVWSHSFTVQSALADRNTLGWWWFHCTVYTAMWCPKYVSRYWLLYALLHLWMLPSSVPTTNRWSLVLLKSKQQPPAREPSVVSSSGSRSVALDTSLSSITSWYTSSLLLMVHSVTRPSLLTLKKLRDLLRSSSCHDTCHTGSVCLPFFTVHCRMGRFSLLRTSYTITVPSYSPTASRLLCCGWKSKHITPLSVVNVYSGWLGFLSE
mmetsp:Transcript_30049/g.74552  ORF Transcript_30049/g.74552 Transcript_30049/m.74552 type:complete len:318 (+) Transcript_30049:163-1116(+)